MNKDESAIGTIRNFVNCDKTFVELLRSELPAYSAINDKIAFITELLTCEGEQMPDGLLLGLQLCYAPTYDEMLTDAKKANKKNRLTQAEMRYLKANYRDYDVMIDIIENTSDSMLYRIFDKCMYSHETVCLTESEFPLMEVCDNVIERNYGWYDEREVPATISKQFSDSLMGLISF